MPFDLSELTFDQDFAQAVTILRSRGAFAAGGWKESLAETINTMGIIFVAGDKALQMIPEGDRVTGSIALITQMRLCTTHQDPIPGPDGTPGGGTSDKVQWNGAMYQILSVGPWKDFGFYWAVMLRLKGN